MDQSSLAFQWLTDNGYPTSGMSQKEGFTTFQLAPILEAYRKFRASGPSAVEIRQGIADKLIRRAEYNERSFGKNAMLAEELRRLAKEIVDDATAQVAPKPNWLHDIDEKAGIE